MILHKKMWLYIASIIVLLTGGVFAGMIASAGISHLFHFSPKTLQTTQTLCVPIFMTILELGGIHLLFKYHLD